MIGIIVGHGCTNGGGYNPGAVNGNYHEFAIAREIAKAAAEYYNTHYEDTATLVNYEGNIKFNDKINMFQSNEYDFIVEIHLNAGGGKGCEAYYYNGDARGRNFADAMCKEVAEALGIPQRSNGFDDGGDKSNINTKFAIVNNTKPTAVLFETCFIDSDDLSHIDTIDKQINAGHAIARGIAKANGATEKYIAPPEAPQEPQSDGTIYRVQVGAFKVKANAEIFMQKIKDAGFEAFITNGGN